MELTHTYNVRKVFLLQLRQITGRGGVFRPGAGWRRTFTRQARGVYRSSGLVSLLRMCMPLRGTKTIPLPPAAVGMRRPPAPRQLLLAMAHLTGNLIQHHH